MKVIIKHNGGVGAYDSLNGGKNFDIGWGCFSNRY
jgi:hypothetical protein